MNVPSDPTSAPMDNGQAPRSRKSGQHPFWRYGGMMAVPALLWILVVVALREPLQSWLNEESTYDRSALTEWLEEARSTRKTLPRLVGDYLDSVKKHNDLEARAKGDPDALFVERTAAAFDVAVRREEVHEHLQALAVPVTKMYNGQLPLFPTIFQLRVDFDDPSLEPILWDSSLSTNSTQYQQLEHRIHDRATVFVQYQLHAYNKRQRIEQQQKEKLWLLSVLAAVGTVLGVGWMVFIQVREQKREREKLLAEQFASESERRREETERKMLEQRLALQDAEQEALQLKSQLYANIGIMAGSYAHNIKNLLVRPNDLLRRCLEEENHSGRQAVRLEEIQQTLGTVTERLQQILRTVRRDPDQTELAPLDLNAMLHDLKQTWKDIAREKWKMDLVLNLTCNDDSPEESATWIKADFSHLQQAIENLLFNARDAIFEMRGHLRESAHNDPTLDPSARREALLAAVDWKGHVTLQTRCTDDRVILELTDNGIGMEEEVRQHCTETHFSTKRDNALFEGFHTGMGLGLSFVATILKHHEAEFDVETEPKKGTTFRVLFPRAEAPAPSKLPS